MFPIHSGGGWRECLAFALGRQCRAASAAARRPCCWLPGFCFSAPVLLRAAVPALLLGVGIVVTAVLFALWRTPATGMTLWTMRIAVAGPGGHRPVGFHCWRKLWLAGLPPAADRADQYSSGLGAGRLGADAGRGGFLLRCAHVPTDAFPTRFGLRADSVPRCLLAVAAWSVFWFAGDASSARGVGPATGAAVCRILRHDPVAAIHSAPESGTMRRRSISAWRCLPCLPLAFPWRQSWCIPSLPMILAPRFWLGDAGRFPASSFSTISGMMYKIAPFLNWLHLQRPWRTDIGPCPT
jgi:hypothetical protein